jgi:hypothetical protein
MNDNNNSNNQQELINNLTNEGYQRCLHDIKYLLHKELNSMEGDDFAYLASHNINPCILSAKELTPELIVEGLIYRH